MQKLTVVDGTKAYRQLRKEVIQAGILNRAYGYYTILAIVAFAGYFFCLYQLYILESPLQLVFMGLLFTVFAVQVGGFLHDAGHRAIAKTTKMNNIVGYLSGIFIVISFGNWLVRHNAHHANPNAEDDPDVDIPVLSFTKERFLSRSGIERFLVQFQQYLYFPILSLATLAQRIGDLKFLLSQRGNPRYRLELVVFVVGLFIWFVVPFLVFPLGKAILLFFVVNFSTGLYMSNIFAPNHKGMPQLKKGIKISFMEQQIMTSRNIKPNWLTDFLYIGLNYQIEHHLFPDCPRNKLKRITPYVIEICKRLKLEYTAVSVLESNKIILRELKQIAATSQ